MKLIWANFQPTIIRQTVDKPAPFSSADTKTTFFFHSHLKLNIDFAKTSFRGADFLALDNWLGSAVIGFSCCSAPAQIILVIISVLLRSYY